MNKTLPADHLDGFKLRLREALDAEHQRIYPATGPVAEPARPPRPALLARRPPLWRLRLAAAVVAVVAVVATTQVVDVGPPAVRDRVGGGAPANAAELGALAAKAVRDVPGPYPKPGQWVYIKTLVARDASWLARSGDGGDRMVRLPAESRAVEWWSKAGKPGEGTSSVTNREGNALLGPPLIQGVSYPDLPSLPTDPDRLLRVIYDYQRKRFDGWGGPSIWWPETFTTIAGMLGNLVVPPELQAALFQAMAKIPGVTVVQDTVDAAGRRGVALALVDDQVRFEVILEKGTYRYLGLANIVNSDHEQDFGRVNGKKVKKPMRKGQVLYRTARLAFALVDGPPKLPRDAAGEPGTASGTGPWSGQVSRDADQAELAVADPAPAAHAAAERCDPARPDQPGDRSVRACRWLVKG